MPEETSFIDAERRLAELMDERAELREELSAVRAGNLVGESTSMCTLFRAVYNAAPGDAPVLITGEVGVGKTSVAGLLHDLSRRSTGRFIAVRCASLPPTLHEVTIFGYVKGAFTGGPRHVPARCEAAELRERGEDVLALARLFVSRLQGPLDRPEVRVSPDNAPR
jgi:DNA-binding NtrC family response regulator